MRRTLLKYLSSRSGPLVNADWRSCSAAALRILAFVNRKPNILHLPSSVRPILMRLVNPKPSTEIKKKKFPYSDPYTRRQQFCISKSHFVILSATNYKFSSISPILQKMQISITFNRVKQIYNSQLKFKTISQPFSPTLLQTYIVHILSLAINSLKLASSICYFNCFNANALNSFYYLMTVYIHTMCIQIYLSVCIYIIISLPSFACQLTTVDRKVALSDGKTISYTAVCVYVMVMCVCIMYRYSFKMH